MHPNRQALKARFIENFPGMMELVKFAVIQPLIRTVCTDSTPWPSPLTGSLIQLLTTLLRALSAQN